MELVCTGKTLIGSKEEIAIIESLCKTLFVRMELSLDGDDGDETTRLSSPQSKAFEKALFIFSHNLLRLFKVIKLFLIFLRTFGNFQE